MDDFLSNHPFAPNITPFQGREFTLFHYIFVGLYKICWLVCVTIWNHFLPYRIILEALGKTHDFGNLVFPRYLYSTHECARTTNPLLRKF